MFFCPQSRQAGMPDEAMEKHFIADDDEENYNEFEDDDSIVLMGRKKD